MSGVSVAFLRGVNVGGHGKLPMAALRELLGDLGARQVQTYIQSGNAVFGGDVGAAAISDAIERAHGFRPGCAVLSRADLDRAVRRNPFSDAESAPKTLHLFFLSGTPEIDPVTLDAVKAPSEHWQLDGRVLYLHTPEGLSSSKLAQSPDRRLGVAATARNWSTVTRVLAMAEEMEASR